MAVLMDERTREEMPNEGEPLPLEEHEAPQFATVHEVAVQPARK